MAFLVGPSSGAPSCWAINHGKGTLEGAHKPSRPMPQTSTFASVNRLARRAAKWVAARTGSVRLYHQLRDREVLTVIMLHRVLPQAMYAELNPDPGYTISTELLDHLVPFLHANYTIVDLSDVLESRRRRRPLPSCPLLVTFDDGWDDNLRYAAPILTAGGIPWTLFVAADAVDSGAAWWQETLLKALRTGRVPYRDLWEMANKMTGSEPAPDDDRELALLVAFGALDAGRRNALLTQIDACECKPDADMADWEGLRGLLATNASIGVHGFSHLPLTALDHPEQDLLNAQELLRSELGASTTAAMSFPHGRYDTNVLAAARKLGFELMFTSDKVLNQCPGGWLNSDMIGRISIDTASVCDRDGKFDSARAERWLILRERKLVA